MSMAKRPNKENRVYTHGILVSREKNEIIISTGEVDRAKNHCKVRQISYVFYMKSVCMHTRKMIIKGKRTSWWNYRRVKRG